MEKLGSNQDAGIKRSRSRKKEPSVGSDDASHDDPSYWEKRRKNNESAKRSREARRAKEERLGMKLVELEHTNMKLRIQREQLQNEIESYRRALGVYDAPYVGPNI